MPETKPSVKELLERATPGPWQAYESIEEQPFPAGVYQAVGTAEGKGSRTSIICDLRAQGSGRYQPEVTQANGELISRAPALARSHERLKKSLEWALDNIYGEYATSGDVASCIKKEYDEASDALAEAEKVSRG